jgi:uncharacterized membrane protein YfcA
MPQPEFLMAFVALSVLAGLFRGFAGFGSGLLMAPLLMVFVPPRVAVPAMLIIALGASARLVPSVWGQWDTKRVAWLVFPAMCSIPFGEYVLLMAPAEIVHRVVSGTVLAMVVIMATGWSYSGTLRWPALVPAGVVSGLLSGMGGVGGPPLVLVNMADSEPDRARANLIFYFVFSQFIAVTGFLVSGVIQSETLWYAGAALVPFFGAIHFGAALFDGGRASAGRGVSLGILAFAAVVGLVAEPIH